MTEQEIMDSAIAYITEHVPEEQQAQFMAGVQYVIALTKQ